MGNPFLFPYLEGRDEKEMVFPFTWSGVRLWARWSDDEE